MTGVQVPKTKPEDSEYRTALRIAQKAVASRITLLRAQVDPNTGGDRWGVSAEAAIMTKL